MQILGAAHCRLADAMKILIKHIVPAAHPMNEHSLQTFTVIRRQIRIAAGRDDSQFIGREIQNFRRSAERRVGKEFVSTCNSGWCPDDTKKKRTRNNSKPK